jgi:hypothetical protein
MEWHIVTASKGGVGKTLTTLLLLGYYLEEEPDTSTLVVDLNAMNTDTSAMLLVGGGNVNETTSIPLESSKTAMWLRATADSRLVVAYPADPFVFYGREQFAELIAAIREKADNKMMKRLGSKPLQRMIIDTNYHFCNLFPQYDEDYVSSQQWQKVRELLKEDDLHVWFIWVYRQLQKILGERTDEITIVTRTAGAIERTFPTKASKLGSLIHTYTPVGLLPTDSDNIGFFTRLFGGGNLLGEDYEIPDLKGLETLPNVGAYSPFTSWLKKLDVANRKLTDSKRIKDVHQRFSKVLYESIENDKDELPINIFPISLYEAALVGYTDKERMNMVTGLQQLDTYKNFKKLLRRKLGHG